MNKDDLITLQHLQDFENRINKRLDAIEASNSSLNNSNRTPNYLRTIGAKKLLKVSDNKLKTMRQNGEIPYTFIAGTYYYPE